MRWPGRGDCCRLCRGSSQTGQDVPAHSPHEQLQDGCPPANGITSLNTPGKKLSISTSETQKK
jgi:hypothetical protein